MKRYILYVLLLVVIAVISSCGSGGGGGEGGTGTGGTGSGPHQYTRAIVKLSTTGITTSIGVDTTIVLPAGVTVKSASPPNTDSTVVVPSGQTSPTSATAWGFYYTAAGITPGTVRVVVGSTAVSGFGPGEFVTVNCDIGAGYFPIDTDFTISTLKVYDPDGATINTATASAIIVFM